MEKINCYTCKYNTVTNVNGYLTAICNNGYKVPRPRNNLIECENYERYKAITGVNEKYLNKQCEV